MKLLNVLIMIAIALPSIALADREGAEGHGGQSVDINGRPVLRDLVDKTVCSWWPANDIIASLPRYGKILESIAKVHWYLAFTYPREAELLSVCMTGSDLMQIPEKDQDGLTIYTKPRTTRQVAIRLNDSIYIDSKLFDRMDQESKAYLMFHEVTHSYIPLNAELRPGKVRSFVAAVRENEKNPMTPKRFGLQLQQNDVDVLNVTSNGIDEYKNEILLALDDTKPALERQMASGKAQRVDGYLRDMDKNMIRGLYAPVRDELFSGLARADVKQVAHALALNADPQELYEGISPLYYAASRGYVAIVELLLSRPDISISRKACSPLHVAVKAGQTPIVDLFLGRSDIDINQTCGGAAVLSLAAQLGFAEIVQKLLAVPGIDVNVIDNDLRTPLMYAAQNGRTDITRMLLAHPNIDVNVNTDATALTLACSGGKSGYAGRQPEYFQITQALLAVPGIDVNQHVGLARTTALHSAIYPGRSTSLVKLLVAAPGIDLQTRNVENRTPIEHARHSVSGDNGRDEMIKTIEDALNPPQPTPAPQPQPHPHPQPLPKRKGS